MKSTTYINYKRVFCAIATLSGVYKAAISSERQELQLLYLNKDLPYPNVLWLEGR